MTVAAMLGCKSPAPSTALPTQVVVQDAGAAPSADVSNSPVWQVFPEYDVPVVPPGITEQELLRRADAEAQSSDAESPLQVTGWQVPPDLGFADAQPVEVLRSQYEITLGDERDDRPSIERTLRLDDQGDRLLALYYGTGLPLAPGFRMGGRTSLSGWALIAADQQSHRLLRADALRDWFFGGEMRGAPNVTFRQNEGALTATRGVLSVSMVPVVDGPERALSCRFFVGLLLGGDASAARAGCAGMKALSRVTLRARGLPVLVFTRREANVIQLPRDTMAVVSTSAEATELALPHRASEGAFFAPNELHGLEPPRAPGATNSIRRADAGHSDSQIMLRNTTSRELLVYVDSVALGWLAAGATTTFQGMQNGPHRVRARSLDGVVRTDEALVNAPGSWTATAAR